MLSPAAHQVIANYLSLPFPPPAGGLTGVTCPYFLNKGNKLHGGLRVLVGKGSPEDIVEEATIVSLRDKLDVSGMTAEQMKKFLAENNIGIDCSGLIYYILDAEAQARGKGQLKNILTYSSGLNPFRRLLIKLRPVENTNVKTFARDANSIPVDARNTQPGDIITMFGSGKEHDRDHMLLVHKVEETGQTFPSPQQSSGHAVPFTIHYTHSLAWRTDGRYHHGVRQGKIIVTDIKKPLVAQRWIEQNKEGDENETLERARYAEKLEIRRLKMLE